MRIDEEGDTDEVQEEDRGRRLFPVDSIASRRDGIEDATITCRDGYHDLFASNFRTRPGRRDITYAWCVDDQSSPTAQPRGDDAAEQKPTRGRELASLFAYHLVSERDPESEKANAPTATSWRTSRCSAHCGASRSSVRLASGVGSRRPLAREGAGPTYQLAGRRLVPSQDARRRSASASATRRAPRRIATRT